MCMVPGQLRELVKQRLAAAAEEIFELFERTITEYKEETERQMETMLHPKFLLKRTERHPSGPIRTKYPLPLHFKDEQEEETNSQEDLDWDIVTSQLWKRDDAVLPSEFEEDLTTTQVLMKSDEEEAPETWTQPVDHNDTVDCLEPSVHVASSGDNLLHLNNTEADTVRGNQSDIYTLENEIKTDPSFIDTPQEGDTTVSKDKLRSGHSKKMYPMPCVCLKCGKAFQWKSKLKRHMKVHIVKTPFSCSVCGKNVSSKWHLQTHMTTHVFVNLTSADHPGDVKNDTPISSKNLEKSSSNQQKDLTLQNQRSSKSEKKHKRPRHMFASRSKLERHMQVHTNLKKKSQNCLICRKVFSSKYSLERHLLVHTGEKPFSCPICEKRFTRQDHVRSHINIHTGVEPCSCSVCGKSFTTRQILKKHMASHDDAKEDQPTEGGNLIYCSMDD